MARNLGYIVRCGGWRTADPMAFAAARRIAAQYRYPDGFTMSNQMKRLVGWRPSDVRQYLGYEWFIEEWLKQERNRTNF